MDSTPSRMLPTSGVAIRLESAALFEHQLQLMTLMSAFAQGFAHQLSSPLSGLLTNLALAREDLVGALEQADCIHEDERRLSMRVRQVNEDLADALSMVERIRGLSRLMRSLAEPPRQLAECQLDAVFRSLQLASSHLERPVQLEALVDEKVTVFGNEFVLMLALLATVSHLADELLTQTVTVTTTRSSGCVHLKLMGSQPVRRPADLANCPGLGLAEALLRSTGGTLTELLADDTPPVIEIRLLEGTAGSLTPEAVPYSGAREI